jgi:predicted amidohydrolase
MRDLKITLVQTNQFWEDKKSNLKHFDALLEKNLTEETDLIVFPEMFHTGFTMNVEVLAEEMTNSVGIDWLKHMAVSRNALCVASLIIKESGCYFNRMVAIFPNGSLEHYDKIHLFTLAGEDKHFSPGEARKTIEFRGWKIHLQVCYDLRFPENARNSFSNEAGFEYDLLLYVANWPERRIAHWDKLLPARAIENQCFVAAVNRIGVDAHGLIYNGSSQVINALGDFEISPIKNKEEVVIARLCYNSLLETRTKLNFLKDRKS